MYENNVDLRVAIMAWEKIPRTFVLDFGKWNGCTLDEVPPSYITYLRETGAPKEHDDLRKALREYRKKDAATQASNVLGGTVLASASSSTRKKKPWVIPDEHTTDYRRYYYNGDRREGQMLIGCNDTLRYFGADPKAMHAAGLRPHHRNQQFWLHQVFSYAQYYGTTKGEMPTKALNKFKAKKYNKI